MNKNNNTDYMKRANNKINGNTDNVPDEYVLQSISDYSKKDYEKIVSKEKTKKYFKRVFFFLILFVVIAISFIISYLYYRNKSHERFIDSMNYKITDLQMEINRIKQEEEEQIRRVEKYQKILKEKLRNIEDKDLSKPVAENFREIKNKTKNVKAYNIIRGNTRFKEISLTFDLASGEDCEFLYNFIKKTGIKVTIFISNENASYKYGSLFKRRNIYWIRKFAKLGNQVEFGNHTWSHFNLVRSLKVKSLKHRLRRTNISDEPLSLERFHKEMMQVEDRFYNLTGRKLTKIWRAPYGAINNTVLKIAARFGYEKHIFWSNNGRRSLDIPDYISKRLVRRNGNLVPNPLFMTGKQAFEMLISYEKNTRYGMNGSIILMHLGTNRKVDKLIYILPDFVKEMEQKGYRFVTVSEIINEKQD